MAGLAVAAPPARGTLLALLRQLQGDEEALSQAVLRAHEAADVAATTSIPGEQLRLAAELHEVARFSSKIESGARLAEALAARVAAEAGAPPVGPGRPTATP